MLRYIKTIIRNETVNSIIFINKILALYTPVIFAAIKKNGNIQSDEENQTNALSSFTFGSEASLSNFYKDDSHKIKRTVYSFASTVDINIQSPAVSICVSLKVVSISDQKKCCVPRLTGVLPKRHCRCEEKRKCFSNDS